MPGTPKPFVHGADPNDRSASTMRVLRRVIIGPAPHGKSTAPKAPPPGQPRRGFRGLPERRARDALAISVRYTGGAEATIEVRARGRVKLYAGDTPIFDIVADVNQWSSRSM